MKLILLFLFSFINLNCSWKHSELKIIPLPLIENKFKSEFKNKEVNNIIQYFIVKGYKECEEVDSLLFSYADSCKMSLLKNYHQYSAYFYKQTTATNEEL